MVKRLLLVAIGLLVLIGAVGGIKFLQIRRMMERGRQFVPPPETVTTAPVREESWEGVLTAVGSLTAVRGLTVAAEVPGKVVRIAFEPGARVKAGDALIQLDTSSEEARLAGAQAQVVLEERNHKRADELKDMGIITAADHDAAVARLKEAAAQADDLRAVIAKKTVRAPFAGRLGVRLVNLGQILEAGTPIVSLQSLDPIFVDFLLPQQYLAQLKTGMTVRVTADALPGVVVQGKITALEPEVDAATRNLRIQATAANVGEKLRPGMFVNVAVVLPSPESVLAVPATAVLYAPYGDSVFVVEEKRDGKVEPAARGKVLRQQFVTLGEKRGDFVAVSGVKADELVVSTGVFKFRNGQAVVVDNTLAPEFHLAPTPKEE